MSDDSSTKDGSTGEEESSFDNSEHPPSLGGGARVSEDQIAGRHPQRALTSQAAIMPRSDTSLVRQGYSTNELQALYALSRSYVTGGQLGLAERIAKGLVAVAPEFAQAWLILAYTALMREDYNEAIFSARQTLRIIPTSTEALLFLVISYFQADDFQTGGTYLGEVADLIRSEAIKPEVKKLYDSQVIRFEERLRVGRFRS
ncbi:MAG: hypothetical protein KDD70_04405 [Bdellovibrionales bacterium]|nr:hypothetical protein [Bdellovibrionales bacterium]